jgi:hypothetical protein
VKRHQIFVTSVATIVRGKSSVVSVAHGDKLVAVIVVAAAAIVVAVVLIFSSRVSVVFVLITIFVSGKTNLNRIGVFVTMLLEKDIVNGSSAGFADMKKFAFVAIRTSTIPIVNAIAGTRLGVRVETNCTKVAVGKVATRRTAKEQN